MQAKLCFLIGWLTTTAALAQGTFTYTFSGDTSPMNVWATFTANQQAVSTGRLTQTNVSGAYILQGGNQWPLYQLFCPVNSQTGQPNAAPFVTYFIAFHNVDEIDIEGGVNYDPYTKIIYYPRLGSPSNFSTAGLWSMTYAVPEPSTNAILVSGLLFLFCVRLSGGLARPTRADLSTP